MRRTSPPSLRVAQVVALTLLLAPAAGGQQAAPADGDQEPPMAPRRPVTTEIHGETLVDPYAWMRDRDDPAVITYLEEENAYTAAMTEHTEELQETLYAEMKGRIKETDLSVPVRRDGWLYYQRTEEGEQYPILVRRRVEGEDGGEAPEEVLLDVNELAEGHDFFRLGVFQVSPDHRLAAWSSDTEGKEDYVLRVKDLASGEMLPDVIPNTSYAVAWGNDNRTLFYTTRDAARRPHKVHRHVLGTDPARDDVVFHEPDERFFVGVERSRDGEYLLIGLGSAVTSEWHYLDADTPEGDFRVVMPRRQEVEYRVGHRDGWFYLVTNLEAESFRVVRARAGTVTPGEWEEVLPHRPAVTVENVHLFAGHMVVQEREAGLRRFRVVPFGDGGAPDLAAAHLVRFPDPAYGVWPSFNPEFDTTTFRYSYTSLTTPRSVYDYDLVSRQRELRKRQEVLGGYDPDDYESLRLYARAGDGTAVPVDLVHRKGLERDGANPTLLYGYGSYGSTLDPGFSSVRVSLLDRGFVIALAHPRGGGELGEAWHEGGRMLSKRNTFTDFIAVAEFLIDLGYTSPDHLAIQGGSAGGLLVGAVLNLRPELFAAAIANVPFVDVINTMLDESVPLTVIEFEEWGNPKEEEYFRYMRSYSPYDNVADRDYPALLVTAGLNDTRVHYWEPAKWTAKLRAANPDGEPVLLKVNMGAGHSGASGRYDALKEKAFEYAFLIDRLTDVVTKAPALRAVASGGSGG